MAISQPPIIYEMDKLTAESSGSANPFSSPVPPPKRLDGMPVVLEREPVPKSTETPPVTPEKVESDAKSDVPQGSTPELEPPKLKAKKKAKGAMSETARPFVENQIIESRSPEGLPSYRCEFAGRDIFVGWPWYKTSNPVTAAVNVAMALDFGRDKIRFDMSIGDSKIEHSRNRLAHKFLETDAKWLFMIDDDIIPSIGRPIWMRHWVYGARTLSDLPLQRHVIHRLMGAGKDIVGAAYFGRQEGGAIMCSDPSLAPRARVYEDAVVPVNWIGTGCILIHRRVFDGIRAKYGDTLKINVPDYDYDYFRPFDSSGGEDVAFCTRAKESGFQPHIDLGLPTFHVGYKTY